jgi:hypothetical protein
VASRFAGRRFRDAGCGSTRARSGASREWGVVWGTGSFRLIFGCSRGSYPEGSNATGWGLFEDGRATSALRTGKYAGTADARTTGSFRVNVPLGGREPTEGTLVRRAGHRDNAVAEAVSRIASPERLPYRQVGKCLNPLVYHEIAVRRGCCVGLFGWAGMRLLLSLRLTLPA